VHRLVLAIALFLSIPTTAAIAQNSAEQLIAAMHERYAQKWYHTLTFEQQSITHKPDGTTSTETWREALLLPGRLRIDFGDPTAGNGALFANNHQYIYRDGQLANEREQVHPLLVLGFDVYGQPVDTTLRQLKELHIDLSVAHEESWDGRAAVVIGAKSGDTHSPQFWIDKERLYFVRLLQPAETDSKVTQDIRFEDYRQVEGGGWLAEHVTLYSGDKLVFEEKYSDVKVNPTLRDDQFDPQHFRPAKN
jgi:hypothetical protein